PQLRIGHSVRRKPREWRGRGVGEIGNPNDEFRMTKCILAWLQVKFSGLHWHGAGQVGGEVGRAWPGQLRRFGEELFGAVRFAGVMQENAEDEKAVGGGGVFQA